MAFQGFAGNSYNNKLLGDVNEVLIKLTSAAVNASQLAPESAPGFTVTGNAAGVYTLTTTDNKAVFGFVGGVVPVNTAAKTISAIALNATAGTFGFTISGGAALAGSEEVHVTLYLAAP
jgi:hypothetical protein